MIAIDESLRTLKKTQHDSLNIYYADRRKNERYEFLQMKTLKQNS